MYGLAVEAWKELQAEIPAAQLQAAGNMPNVTRKPSSLHNIFPNYTGFLQAPWGVKFPDRCGSFSQGSEIAQNGEFSAILQSQVV